MTIRTAAPSGKRLLGPQPVARGGNLEDMTVLISGASGSVGGAVFARLRQDGVEVRGGSRHPQTAGLPATFVRGGCFATNSLRWAGAVRSDGPLPLPYPLSRLAPVHEGDLAEVAAAALTSDALVGAAPVITGPGRLTRREMVVAIGAALGRTVEVEEVSDGAAGEHLASEFPAPIIASVQAFFAEQVDHPAALSETFETITGHPGRTFATWADDHLDAFA